MVSVAEFETVQKMLDDKNTRPLDVLKPYSFRGLLTCSECGCMITAETKTKRFKNGTSRQYTYYHCTRKRPCSQKVNVRKEDLEQQFSDAIKKYTIHPKFKEWALEVLATQNELEAGDISAVLASQSRAIESSHQQVKRLIQMAASELISEGEFKQSKADLEQQIVQLEEEREDTKKRAESWYNTAVRVFDFAVHGRQRFIEGDVVVKRELLADFGQNPTLLNGKLQITPHKWLIPIKNNYPELKLEYDKVRTLPEQIQKEAVASIRSVWLAR